MTEKIRKDAENFLYYHKGNMIAGCLVIALLFSAVFSYSSGEPETVLYGEMLNQTVSEEVLLTVCEQGSEALGKDPEQERILIGTGLEIDVEEPERNSANGALEKMTTQIFSHELDFLIGPPEVMDYYAGLGGLCDMDEWIDEIQAGQEFQLVQSCGKDGIRKNYGIDISGSALAAEDGRTVFCILNNSEHKEDAVTFFKSLMNLSDEER